MTAPSPRHDLGRCAPLSSHREILFKVAEDHLWKQENVGRYFQFHRGTERVAVTFGHHGGIVRAYWRGPCGHPSGMVRSSACNKLNEVAGWLAGDDDDD
jgi:hypothetical protein